MSHRLEPSSKNAKQSQSGDSLPYSIVILDGSQRLSPFDSIEVLPLSIRVRNALMRGGIRTIGALLSASEFKIRSIRNVGQKTLDEIQDVRKRLHPSARRLVSEKYTATPGGTTLSPQLAAKTGPLKTGPSKGNHLLVVELRQSDEDLSNVIEDNLITKQLNSAGINTIGDLLCAQLLRCVRIEGISIEAWKEILRNYKLKGDIRSRPLSTRKSPPCEVKQLGLSVRTANCLLKVGITDLQQITQLTFADVLSIRHFGPYALGELLTVLREKSDEINLALLREEDGLMELRGILPNLVIDKLIAFGINELEDLGQYTFEDLILKAKLTYREAQQVSRELSATGVSLSTHRPRQPLVSSSDYQYLKRMGIPLDKISISRLALSTALERGLKSLGIATIDSVATQSKAVLETALGTRGEEYVEILTKSLKVYFAWLPTQNSWEDEMTNKGIGPLHLIRFREATLERVVEDLLSYVTYERYRKVIRLRFGLDGGGRRTLDEVGERFSLTRERIRQMERKAIGKMKRGTAYGLVRVLYISIEDEMKARGGLMTTAQIGEHVADLMDIGEIYLDGAILLLLSLQPGRFVEIDKNRRWGLKETPLNLVGEVSSHLIEILNQVHAPLPLTDLISRLREMNLYSEEEMGSLIESGFIEACLSTNDYFERTEDEQWGLSLWQRGRTDEIVMALRRLGKPSHYAEIARVANEMLPPSQRASDRIYHAQLGNKPHLFVWVGPGTFGLAEWGLKRARFYVDIAEDLLQKRDEPLTFDEIFPVINAEREASPQSIQFMLSTNPRFHQYPENRFGLANWLQESDEEEEDDTSDPFLENLKRKVFDDF